MDALKATFVSLEKGASNLGLKVNDRKTRYMVVSLSVNMDKTLQSMNTTAKCSITMCVLDRSG